MEYIEREIESSILSWLEAREILIIRGSRQSGKTTLLNRIKEKLLSKGVKEEQIHYFTFEELLLRSKFEEDSKEFIEFLITDTKKHYFLLDEVQYVKNIGQKLKLIFDLFNNVKIIVSGSSSFDLTNLGEFLVGRVIFFDLYPFSFAEFLKSKGKNYDQLHKKIQTDILKPQIKKTIFLEELNKLLHEYLTFGSYPRIVLEKENKNKKELLKNLFTTYVEKDLVSRYGVEYREKSIHLLKILAHSLGNIINYDSICAQSGLNYREVKEILPILEDTYTISIVKPFYKNILNELRKNPKIYFIDFGLRNCILENFDQLNFDHLYENFVLNEIKRKYKVNYWRTTSKAEVDFIIQQKNKIIPIEVKTTPKITRALRSFIQHYNPKQAFIINLNLMSKSVVEKTAVYKMPFVHL